MPAELFFYCPLTGQTAALNRLAVTCCQTWIPLTLPSSNACVNNLNLKNDTPKRQLIPEKNH